MAEYDPKQREAEEQRQAREQEQRAGDEERAARERSSDSYWDPRQARWDARQSRWEAKWARRQARWDERRARWGMQGPPGRRPHAISGLFVGIILTTIGVLFLLQNLGVYGFEDAWNYWPVILIALGVSRAASSYGWGGRVWGGTLVAVGTILLLEKLDLLPRFAWGQLWPLIIVGLGISMLVKNLERQHRRDNAPDAPAAGAGIAASPTIGGGSSGAVGSTLNEWAIFSGVRRRVDSQEFEGGEVTAVFGGAEIDLRGAGMKKEEVIVDINAVFGGVDMRVPETWEIVMRGAPIFGGFEDQTTVPRALEGKKTPRLIIVGSAVFGGVSVKN